jgi:hypothetical protein
MVKVYQIIVQSKITLHVYVICIMKIEVDPNLASIARYFAKTGIGIIMIHYPLILYQRRRILVCSLCFSYPCIYVVVEAIPSQKCYLLL